MVGEIVYSIHLYSYLDESVAETLADALNWDLGVAVVVAVVVAHSHLQKVIDAGVSKVVSVTE